VSLAATLAGAAAARSQAYWLLSRFIEIPPDAELVQGISDFFSAAAGGMGPELAGEVEDFAANARGLANAAMVDGIAVEHTRLFAGLSAKEGMPPIESAIREGRMLGGAASAVAIAYAEAGFPEPLSGAIAPDHAAAQLRFLSLCCHSESRAWTAGDVADGAAWLARERDFLEAHPVAWLPGYCDAAAGRASHPFFSSGLRVIATMLPVDLGDVREMLARAEREMTASAARS
jgi:TorA maturation chaperone TorD